MLREQLAQHLWRCLDRLECVRLVRDVHHAADALELAQVQTENRRVSHAILLWKGTVADPRGSAAGLHGFFGMDRGGGMVHWWPSVAWAPPRPLNGIPLSRGGPAGDRAVHELAVTCP